jgi:hypothetical protein
VPHFNNQAHNWLTSWRHSEHVGDCEGRQILSLQSFVPYFEGLTRIFSVIEGRFFVTGNDQPIAKFPRKTLIMKTLSIFSRSHAAKTLLVAVTAMAACLHSGLALITIPRDFPLELTNGEQALGKTHLAKLVSVYRNDVVLLANPEEAFDKEIREATGTLALREKLQKLATAGGAELTAESLGAAAAALTRQNPSDAPLIMASAMELLSENPRKVSLEDRYTVARGVISGLPYELKDRSPLIASVIGIAARGLKEVATTDLVRRLRDFAIHDYPIGERDFKGAVASVNDPVLSGPQASQALALDEALVAAGILSPYTASPEFLVLANNFAADQLAETFFSGDQGVINQGAVFAPGSPGSPGGSGSSGNQINPEPPPAS